MLDFDWNQLRTSIPAQTRVTAGHVKIASPPVRQKRKHILARYGRTVMTLTFVVIASSLIASFSLHTIHGCKWLWMAWWQTIIPPKNLG